MHRVLIKLGFAEFILCYLKVKINQTVQKYETWEQKKELRDKKSNQSPKLSVYQ